VRERRPWPPLPVRAKPSWWEHQLGDLLDKDLHLDPDRFAEKAVALGAGGQ